MWPDNASQKVSARVRESLNSAGGTTSQRRKEDGMEGEYEARRTGRRNLLRGALAAASMGAPSLAGCATAASAQRSRVIQAPVGAHWPLTPSHEGWPGRGAGPDGGASRFRAWPRTAATTKRALGWSHPAS